MLQKLHYIGLTSYDPLLCPQFCHINRQQAKSLPRLLPPTECWTAMNPDAIKAIVYLIQLSSSSQILFTMDLNLLNSTIQLGNEFRHLSSPKVSEPRCTPVPLKFKLGIWNLKGPSRFGDKLTTCTMHKTNIQNYDSFIKNLCRSPHPTDLKEETSLDIRRVPT